MNAFELKQPDTLAEAIEYLDPDDPTVRPIAGGSALMLMMKAGVFQPTRLVSLSRIERRYSSIDREADGVLRIGALATLSSLAATVPVARHAGVIPETLRTLSNVRVRNVATLGGHLAHADPHMDLPPVLIALDAQVCTMGPSGQRMLPLQDLYQSYLETVLASNELITEIVVPSAAGRYAAYLKCTTRSADDWPTLGVAVALGIEDGRITAPRLVVSAATETAMRLPAAERELGGAQVDAGLVKRAAEAAAGELELVPDARGSAAYKRHLVRVYVARALGKVFGQALGQAAGVDSEFRR